VRKASSSYLSAEPFTVQGRSGEGVSLAVSTPVGAQTIEASDILIAIGRIPNSTGIGVDAAGVTLDARGYIRVNDRLETTAPDVWAIGECAGTPQFTHASVDDFRIIRDNLAGGARITAERLVPYCVFTERFGARAYQLPFLRVQLSGWQWLALAGDHHPAAGSRGGATISASPAELAAALRGAEAAHGEREKRLGRREEG
jgi:hypothetical protein